MPILGLRVSCSQENESASRSLSNSSASVGLVWFEFGALFYVDDYKSRLLGYDFRIVLIQRYTRDTPQFIGRRLGI